jgi:hypothetical protein
MEESGKALLIQTIPFFEKFFEMTFFEPQFKLALSAYTGNFSTCIGNF